LQILSYLCASEETNLNKEPHAVYGWLYAISSAFFGRLNDNLQKKNLLQSSFMPLMSSYRYPVST